ncbi:MAG: hypothetical protein V4603_16410 [Pseudomonadota bacterium]
MTTTEPSAHPLTRLSRLSPVWTAVVISCVLSLLRILQNPILNDDAYGYLRAAELFASDGADAVFSQYSWYSYSILIALFDPILPGGLVASAHVLNTLLLAALVGAFVTLCRELQPGSRIAWLAALTILLFPMLNEMRFMVIRDFGFLAGALWSLLFLLRYQQSAYWQHALYWCGALLLATAFRLEALLLLAVAPMALIGTPRKSVILYAVMLAVLAVLAILCLLLQLDVLALIKYSYRYYLPQLTQLPSVLSTNADALGQTLFTADNEPGSSNTPHSLVILLFAYGFSVLTNLAQAISVPVSILLLHAAWRGWLRRAVQGRAPLLIYIACSALSLLVFISIMHFLTQRYATLLSLLLLLLVPGVLNRWYEHAVTQHKVRRLQYVAGFFCFYYVVDSLISFGHSRAYLGEALVWTQANVPADAPFITNHRYLAYESGRVGDYDKVQSSLTETMAKLTPNASLALALKSHDAEARMMLERDTRLTLLQNFSNARGDEVRIYSVH